MLELSNLAKLDHNRKSSLEMMASELIVPLLFVVKNKTE